MLRGHVHAFSAPRRLWAVYLGVALPFLLLTCLLTGPFQVPDEPAHFLRAVAISHGQVRPQAAVDRTSAGGEVETGAIRLARTFGDFHGVALNTRYRFDLHRLAGFDDRGRALAYTRFSNTVIYFPLAHAAPGLTIALARALGARPLVWLYAARLANALVAAGVTALALHLAEGVGAFLLTIALLPMTVFETASVSADASVIAFALLFCALMTRQLNGRPLGAGDLALTALCLLYVCVGKLAYLPLCCLPVIAAALQRRPTRDVLVLGLLAGACLLVWLGWAFVIHDDVFTIRTAEVHVDAKAQLAGALAHPATAMHTFGRSMAKDAPRLLGEMVGARLGWGEFRLPSAVVYTGLACLACAALARPGARSRSAALTAAVALTAGACLVFIYLAVFLEFTPVGRHRIEGAQGRYLLPLLALAPIALPGSRLGERWAPVATLGIAALSILTLSVTELALLHRYWA